MARTRYVSTTAALIVCLIGHPWSGNLFASEDEPTPSTVPTAQSASSPLSEARAAIPVVPIDQAAAPGDVFSFPPSALKRAPLALAGEGFTADAPASEDAVARSWQGMFNFIPAESAAFAQRGYRGRGPRDGRNGAAVALIIGAAASIAGTAILVYANRPECSTYPMGDGCGYGTKVVGGAVLSAGLVSFVVGALTWR